MKNILLTIFFISAFLCTISAQNIVPNYSFEQADSCPTTPNNRTYKYSLGCVGWGQANQNTTDYYNACDTAATSIGLNAPKVGVPNNIIGSQGAFDGNAYAGIVTYLSGFNIYKEYLIRDIPPLQKDTAYKVTIYVSLADSSRFATDGLGVFFTTYGSPNQYNIGTLIAVPQIDYTNYGIISDTVHWTKLTSVFVADSAYDNIIIGCFKRWDSMRISDYNGSSSINVPNIAYYYVDNVVVEKASSTSVNTKNNSNKFTVYPNPFTDYAILLVDNSNNNNHTLVLFNAMGQNVQIIESTGNRIRIERNDLPAGFYYYQLYNEQGFEANGKLIIK